MSWTERAACRTPGVDPDWFYPERQAREASNDALRVCAGCPVLWPCRQWALTHDEQGVWGGLTERERRDLARRREAS